VHPFVPLAPYALIERGAVAAEVAAGVEMGTLVPVVDKGDDVNVGSLVAIKWHCY
jgi:hypothetical protein